MPTQTHLDEYSHVLSLLLPPRSAAPVLPPQTHPAQPTPLFPYLTASIARLQLHPTLEALLHLLNLDLPSAHFLVRHMQAAPKWEGMLLHAILHRIEGDYENAKAWYSDVHEGNAQILGFVWEWEEGVKPKTATIDVDQHASDDVLAQIYKFLDRTKALEAKASTSSTRADWQEEKHSLEHKSEQEMKRLLNWCESLFGKESYGDASKAWVSNGEKVAEISEQMLLGGEGWRQF